MAQGTGQLVASVVIHIPADATRTELLVTVPLGLSIPAGVSYDIDGTRPGRLDLVTCDRGGCLATASPLAADALSAMQGGQKLNIIFASADGQPITLAMSLAGFTAALQKIR